MNELKVYADGRVVDYSITDDALATLRKNYQGLKAETTAGYEEVRKAIADIRARRVAIEAKRKELKADALEYGRIVDAEAHRITAALEAIEAPLKIEKQRVDDEAERKRKAKEEAERKKIEDELRVKREAEEAKARALREEEEKRLAAERKKLEEERAAMEAERKRQEEERKAIELQTTLRVQAIEATAKAEREKLEAERKKMEAEQRAERERLVEERHKIMAAEEARLAAKREAEAAIARAEHEKQMAERRKVEAAELAARLEALKPDAEKLKDIAGKIKTLALGLPSMATVPGQARLTEINSLLMAAAASAERELKP